MTTQTPRVCLVMVTYNRYAILVDTIVFIHKQARRPDYFVIVDNASTDGTFERLQQEKNDYVAIQMGSNLGYGAAAAEGMRWAANTYGDITHYWIMDDDTRPSVGALAALLTAYQAIGSEKKVGLIGLVGFDFTIGGYKPNVSDVNDHRALLKAPLVVQTDFVLMDGSLVSSDAVKEGGVYREDYFMIGEDYEYCKRMVSKGFKVALLKSPDAVTDRLVLGGGGKFTNSNIWRGYYQARNQFHIMKTYFSAQEATRYFLRQIKFLVASMAAPNRFRRMYYRLLGIYHGMTGVSGRTVEPFN